MLLSLVLSSNGADRRIVRQINAEMGAADDALFL